MARVLVVDDSRETCEFLEELLGTMGLEVRQATDPDRASALLGSEPFDLMLSDINLEAGKDGLDLLRVAKPKGVDVILLSGFGTLETAIEAVREGAFDFLSKPWDNEELKALVKRALESRAGKKPAPPPAAARKRSLMIGSSPKMMAVYKTIASLQDSAATVLVTGESGTGKELVARSIHLSSPRKERPFVAVNCGAITETLLESELFGHTKGSFTGATVDKKGLFEEADGGTIFLDEVGETTPNFQVKLLRVLQEHEVRPVGSTRAVSVDARVVAATNVDLERAVAEHRFRHDLYYRLSVVVISLPPLRERRGDIPLLIQQFLHASSARRGRTVAMTAGAIEALTRYDWPGNVRELENTIERLVVFSRGDIDVGDLPPMITAARPLEERVFEGLPTLDELERRYLIHVLEAVGGNRTRAAEALGVDRRTLYRMAERFGIDLTDDGSSKAVQGA